MFLICISLSINLKSPYCYLRVLSFLPLIYIQKELNKLWSDIEPKEKIIKIISVPEVLIIILGLFIGVNQFHIINYTPAYRNLITPVIDMNAAHSSSKNILLNNGDVLILGGSKNNLTEIYDHTTKIFKKIGRSAYARNWYTATLLNSGNVLIMGGMKVGENGFESIAQSEIYNSQTQTFFSASKMIYPRAEQSAVLLNNGLVLITGGKDESTGQIISSAELYAPSKNTFIKSSNMCIPRYKHSSILLNNGKVLIIGGKDANSQLAHEAELYDPKTNTFNCIGKSNNKAEEQSFILLNDGRVFIVGGGGEIYNPKTNTFKRVNNKYLFISSPITFKVSDDNVLILSTIPTSIGISKKEKGGIYNLKTNEYKDISNILDGRMFFSATQLKDNDILITGGTFKKGNTTSAYLINTNKLYKEK